MIEVSVVMVSYYTGPALWLAIDSVLDQSECRELLLVDNGNMPGTMVRLNDLAAREPRLKLITGHGNIGFSRACNLGARSARADHLLFLNPDCMLFDGDLARALTILKRYPDSTLAGCYLIHPDGNEQRGCRRSLLTPRNAVIESLGLKRFFREEDPLNFDTMPMPAQVHEVPAISGAFMLISKSFFDRLKGFDEGYFLHMEDMDFCCRVHALGGKVICMPEIRVIHFRSTSEVANAKVEAYKAKSFIRYLKKHFSHEHSALFLMMLSAGIWLRFCLKVISGAVDRFFVPPLVTRREIARIALLYRLTRFGPRDDSLKGKTVLVTGASGQTGLCVVGQALARGAHVVAVYNNTRIPFWHTKLEWVQQDLNKYTLDRKADVLIHTAALWLLPSLMPTALEAGIRRIIAFGSTSMLAKINSKNEYEQDVVAQLKRAENDVMKIAEEKQADVTILRPTMIYGVGLDANLTRMADVIRRFGFIAIYENAKGIRHPVQAVDLATAALDIIDNPATFAKAYNLGGKQTMTYLAMVTVLFHYLGKKTRIFRPPMMPRMLDILGKLYQYGSINGEMARRMNQDLLFPIEDAVRDFGYHPRGFLQGDVVI